MKRGIFPLFFLLLFGVTLSAQKIGIKAGGNFANVIGADNSKSGTADKHTFIPGFHAGIFGELDMGQVVSLQVEACYSTKGFKQKYTSSSLIVNTTQDVQYTYSYIDVPFLVNLHFGSFGGYYQLGPQVSFLSGVKWDGDITNQYTNMAPPPLTNTSQTFTFSGKDKDGYSKTDFGLVMGFGAKWESGIEYCLRGAYGVTNVIDQSVSTSDAVWHNLVFSVSIGYAFNAGGGGQKDRYGRSYNKKKR